MNLSAIYHNNWLEYREALEDGRVRIRLRAARDDLDQVTLFSAGIYSKQRWDLRFLETPMRVVLRDEWHDWFEADYLPDDPRTCYFFGLKKQGETRFFDQDGVKTPAQIQQKPLGLNPFPFAYAYAPEPLPHWAQGKVGYQIFPDRFFRAGPTNKGLEPWQGGRVSNAVVFGGNLAGIREKIPYLKQLGVGFLYLTPVFLSDTAHRYNTHDYYQIDPLLGDMQDLKDLVLDLHQNGMRMLLDGVFNHSGTRFAPFLDAREKGRDSPYHDWFFFDKQHKNGYHSFAFEPRMPKLNLKNPQAAAYFLDVGRYYLREIGVDGWRLDVSPEVWPDFWRQFRKMVKQENPEAILVAECWDRSQEWVSVGDMFDGTMNYLLSRAIWRFLANREVDLVAFDSLVNRSLTLYPSRKIAMQWNFIGSHDTPRFVTRAGDRQADLLRAAFLLFTLPGTPILYYGDELGMQGDQDPDCRRPMRWDLVEDNPVYTHFQKLMKTRNALPALMSGGFQTVYAGEEGVYAYLRTPEGEGQAALCVVNTSDHHKEGASLRLPLPRELKNAKALMDQLSGDSWPVTDGAITLPLLPGLQLILTAP